MEKEFDMGLLFRNLPEEVDQSDGLSTQLDLRTDLAQLIAGFGETIRSLKMLGENMAIATFKNKPIK